MDTLSGVTQFVAAGIPTGITLIWTLLSGIPGPYIFVASLLAFAAALWVWKTLFGRRSVQDWFHPSGGDEKQKQERKRKVATDTELRQPFLANRTVYIARAVEHSMHKLVDRTFEDCDIVGPAVLMTLPSYKLQECHWERPAGFPEEVLYWYKPSYRDHVLLFGSILLENCVFRRCRFLLTGIAASDEMLKRAREQGRLDAEDLTRNEQETTSP